MKTNFINACILLTGFLCFLSPVLSQKALSAEEIASRISYYKNDVRGTYKNIRWFCKDGSILEPKNPCPDSIGGIQHANYKDGVIELAKRNHLFFGEILSFTEPELFWDAGNNHSRCKQYQLGKYLANIDNGWVNQKGQFYRGAIQIEDEESWGVDFYKWLLKDKKALRENYFLIFQSFRDIPHKGDTDVAQKMRAESKILSDEFVKFMDLRIKIHSNPQPEDISAVQAFLDENRLKMSLQQISLMEILIKTMLIYHAPPDLKNYAKFPKSLREESTLKGSVRTFLERNQVNAEPAALVTESAHLLLKIRYEIDNVKYTEDRLKLLAFSQFLDQIIRKESVDWQTPDLRSLLMKMYALSEAVAGSGCIELWEWENILAQTVKLDRDEISLKELNELLELYRSVVEWSAAMVKAQYNDVVKQYVTFEPKAAGFLDDRIRSTAALQLGLAVEQLSIFIAQNSASNNHVLGIPNQSSIRGLNPGFAMGELVIVEDNAGLIEFSGEKIYMFNRAPADLKPVAGIATVSEGNPVSHVQLLARNLGIPNAVISDQNLSSLKEFDGLKVFYAVSPKGNVIIKPVAEMSDAEKSLFSKKSRSETKIVVPIRQIRLDSREILDLKKVKAADSGKICGPKAANLGDLKSLFPENVVDGFVIPFGIFRDHMDLEMPGQNMSYWNFLTNMFEHVDSMRMDSLEENIIEKYQFEKLNVLRESIKKIEFLPSFITELESAFRTYLGAEMGQVPVFLRSDTNMEDLKDFTGAGLNLTVFNTVERNKILQGIKDVWSSPYTERSFKWRQKYLLNPENVFPSILIIPSVDVDYSGVLITKGIASGNEEDLTVAFSRGAGGAVDGQAAELYLVHQDSTARLLSPARELYFNKLPKTGGTSRERAYFNKGILNQSNLESILNLANFVESEDQSAKHENYQGAYDIELGFKDDHLWLFQIRPFVENKMALGSNYLESINQDQDISKSFPLTTKISD